VVPKTAEESGGSGRKKAKNTGWYEIRETAPDQTGKQRGAFGRKQEAEEKNRGGHWKARCLPIGGNPYLGIIGTVSNYEWWREKSGGGAMGQQLVKGHPMSFHGTMGVALLEKQKGCPIGKVTGPERGGK